MKNFRGLVRGVGNQPLLLVAVGVVLVGFVAAMFSQGATAKQSLIFSPKKPSQALVLGDNSQRAGDQDSQDQSSSTPRPQNSSNHDQDQSSDSSLPQTGSGAASNPLPIQKPPVIIPSPTPSPTPAPLPCNYCTPAPGRFCPLAQSDHIIYPCNPCGGVGETPDALACREIE